ncbi:MAG: hypothetical protein ABIB79_03380 [archaeon]
MEEENLELNEDEREVDVLEFSLDDNEIDEFIEKLSALKITKTNISFEVDDENELLINYEENEDEDDEDDSEEDGEVRE